MITLDVANRVVQLEVDESTLALRRARWVSPPLPQRGWARLYIEHVQQADKGADLDFLVGNSGSGVARDSH
jgi:L-arabonate dehydrase